MPTSRTILDDRHERLAGHVAAEDHDLGFVVLAGIQELPPARLRAVDVGREIDARLGFLRKESGYHGPPSTSSGNSYQRLRSPILARIRQPNDLGSSSMRSCNLSTRSAMRRLLSSGRS